MVSDKEIVKKLMREKNKLVILDNAQRKALAESNRLKLEKKRLVKDVKNLKLQTSNKLKAKIVKALKKANSPAQRQEIKSKAKKASGRFNLAWKKFQKFADKYGTSLEQ